MPEDYISLAQAAQRTPSRVSPATVWRWARRGVKSRIGKMIQLQHVRVGGRVFTKQRWLDEFFAAVAAADLEHQNRILAPQAPPHDEAEAMLKEAGL
ncbi:MAG: DUF1580 domain-containing protein [Phycisphaerae bacterium]|jgi:hypothetical protein